MLKKSVVVAVISLSLVACASVPLESKEKSDMAKKFAAPANGQAGLYIYRSGSFGGALKKDVWVDGTCVGQTAPNIFFYDEIQGNAEHKISTESEFSPNELVIKAESGKNYFVRQYIKMGVFVGGAGVELATEAEGKKAIADLDMAKQGSCSK